MELIVTCMPGLAPLLTKELTHLGLAATEQGGAAVTVTGSADTALRICMWSRIAERVMLPINTVKGDRFDELPTLIEGMDWAVRGDGGCAGHGVVHDGWRGR